MRLIPHWRWLVRKAWSIRLIILSGLLSGCEVVLPLFVDTMPRNVFAVLAVLAAIGSGVARVMVQPSLDRRAATPGDRRKQPRARFDGGREDYD